MSGFSQRVLVRFSCWRIRGWSRWGIHVFGLAFLILATTSCVGWKDLRANYKDGQFGEQNFLNAERAGYKNSNTPRDCLALSGGGIRSAAYSIGALKGLHLIGKLRNLDTISAVSGGSYAATWLYAQYARKAPQASYLDTVLDEAVLDEVLSGAKIKEVAGNAKDLVGTLVALGLLNVDLPSSDFGVTSLVGGAWNLISLIPGLGSVDI